MSTKAMATSRLRGLRHRIQSERMTQSVDRKNTSESQAPVPQQRHILRQGQTIAPAKTPIRGILQRASVSLGQPARENRSEPEQRLQCITTIGGRSAPH